MILLNRRWALISLLACYLTLSPKENNEFVNAFAFSPNSSNGNGIKSTHAPVPVSVLSTSTTRTSKLNVLHAANADETPINLQKSFVLTKEEVAPLLVLEKEGGKEKWINAYGIVHIIAMIVTLPLWWSAMAITDSICNAFPDLDPNRAFYDKTGKIWSKAYLTITNSFPTISGEVDRLNESNEPHGCLYVANHASWLDIPVLCTVLSPLFKFIAKGELLKVPCIGKQLVGGNHILIDREDRRSQLRTFKEGVGWLNNNVPLMAFPEGKRSMDGRLMEFKGGIFSMAVRAKVPIVPISVSNTHAIMPSNALLPVQSGAGKLHVHVHPPIDVEGKSEAELADLVRTALLSKIPLGQHPLPEVTDEVEDDSNHHLKANVASIVPEIIKSAISHDAQTPTHHAHATSQHAHTNTPSTIKNTSNAKSNNEDLQKVE